MNFTKRSSIKRKKTIIINDNNTFLTIPTQNNYKNESFNILVFGTWAAPNGSL